MGCSGSVPYALFGLYAPEGAKLPEGMRAALLGVCIPSVCDSVPYTATCAGHKAKASDEHEDAGDIKAYGGALWSWGSREPHGVAAAQVFPHPACTLLGQLAFKSTQISHVFN